MRQASVTSLTRTILLLLVASGAYLPALDGGFIWDDISIYVVENHLLRAPDGIVRFWFSTEPIDYYPLAYSTFWFEWRLWGTNPIGYHVVNVLIHALGSVLVWRILLRLEAPGAWWVAALFAAHPVCVETVAWISQRKTVLATTLAFAALLAFLEHGRSGRRAWYATSLGLFALALASKPSVIALPLILLGVAWWMRGRIARSDWVRSIPFFLVSILFGIIGVWFQTHRALGSRAIRDDGLFGRIAIAGRAFWFYLEKALVPLDLGFVYPRWEIDPTAVVSYVPTLAALTCLSVAWRGRATWGRPLLAAFGYYVVMLLPALGFVDVYYWRYSFVADHYQYAALVGPIALVIGFCSWFTARCGKAGRPVGSALATIALVACFVLSWRQSRLYENEETLWRDTLSKNPKAWLAHNNLGALLAGVRRFDEARKHYGESLRIAPEAPEAHYNLGRIAEAQGKTDEALRRYRDSISVDGEYAKAHNNLAVILQTRGDRAEAVRHFQEALRLDPSYPEALVNLGNALAAGGDVTGAIDHYRTALRIDPEFANAHYNLATFLVRSGHEEEAHSHFQRWRELTSKQRRNHGNRQ